MGCRRALLRTGLAFAFACAAGTTSPAAQGDDLKDQCIAAADQGQAQRDDNKLTSARASFKTCSQAACPKLIAKSCTKWLGELDATIPSLAVTVKDDQGAALADVRVTMDGAPLAASTDGTPVDVDPGNHVLRFEHAGSTPDEERVSIKAGDKSRAVTVVMHAAQSTTTTPPPPTSDQLHHEQTPSHAVFTARNVVAGSMLLAGIGVGLGGAYFLGQSGSASSNASNLRGTMATTFCTDNPANPTCQQISDAVNQQHNDNNVGIAMVAGGGALAVGAIVVWLVWPSPKTEPETTAIRWVSPSLARGGLTLDVGGAW
jgi:hypothetical protein